MQTRHVHHLTLQISARVLMTIGALTLLAACTSLESSSTGTITKTEARSWPPERVKQRVLQQFAGIVQEQGLDRNGQHIAPRTAPVRPLTDIWYETKPRPTRIPGLCRQDILTIEFASVGTRDLGAETPAHANGFKSFSQFHFISPPATYADEIQHQPELVREDACTKLDSQELRFFTAGTAEEATDGYWLINRVIEGARLATARFAIICGGALKDKRDCAPALANLRLDELSEVARCQSDLEEYAYSVCYRVSIGSYDVRIIASYSSSAKDAPPPMSILNVRMEEVITFADLRLD